MSLLFQNPSNEPVDWETAWNWADGLSPLNRNVGIVEIFEPEPEEKIDEDPEVEEWK